MPKAFQIRLRMMDENAREADLAKTKPPIVVCAGWQVGLVGGLPT